MKKLLNGLLALVMTLSMFAGINVNAAGNGSITLTGAKANRTYDAYRILDLTLGGTNNDKVSYKLNNEWETFFTTGDGKDFITDTYTTGLNEIVVNGVVKYLNITQDNVAELSKLAQKNINGKNIDGSATATADGNVTISNLAYGYYLVFPEGATESTENNGVICSLTSTVPTAEIRIKATYPTVTKVAAQKTAEVGQDVVFDITSKVPDTTGYDSTNYIFELTDTMDAGLSFNQNSLKVYVDGTEINNNYTLTPTTNGFTLSINVFNLQNSIGKEIKVEYTAKVTNAAINVISENEVELKYSRRPGSNEFYTTGAFDRVTDTSIEVVKVDGNDEETLLAGAKFVLKNSKGKYYAAKDAQGNLITTTEAANINSTDNVANVTWVDDIENATVLTTGSDGKVNFAGLAEGTKYYLVETEAPEGYNKLVDPTEVTTNTTNTKTATTVTATSITVENYSGSTLPSTGSTGTKIFLTVGLILAIGAYVVFITNKRMENYE